MNNFKIQLNSDKNTIIIKYYDLVHSRTLFTSLEELIGIGMLERVSVILDFNEASALLVSYRQMINFRIGLNALPAKKISSITIISKSPNMLIYNICSATKLVEDHVMKVDLRCFEVNSGDDVYQCWS